MDRKPMIAGNWKMNLNQEDSVQLVKAIAVATLDLDDVDVLVAPTFTNLRAVREAIGENPVLLAGQNMHPEPDGAYTGEISGKMLMDVGCTHVILGHSERRSLFHESDEFIDRKAKAAVTLGLIPIVCIGETLAQREAKKTMDVLKDQMEGSLKHFREGGTMTHSTLLAYEPVWAIGTGKTATPEQAQEAHGFIRRWLQEVFDDETAHAVRILYGGSVKPDNAAELMAQPDIDGALVGGASLKAESFVPIIRFRDG
jgi:triosephosphate isomerase